MGKKKKKLCYSVVSSKYYRPWYGSDHISLHDITSMLVQLLPAMLMRASQ